jgi:LDH2 family malate/lactate/ureidoglycolate dehydrogenase
VITNIHIADGMNFMVSSMIKNGFPENQASQIAEVIMDSELRGHADHGLFFFQAVLKWPDGLGMNIAPQVSVVDESATSITIDGDNGCGVIGLNLATEMAIDKARSQGMAAGIVKNTQNVVALAPFVQNAADNGLIALACSGFRFPVVPPVGGLQGVLGTNPFAFSAPAGRHSPFLLDMSTTGIAGAKVFEARDRGESLPEGLVETLDGAPITNPAEFKIGESLLLPMAGVKGFGLAMMVDILATVLSGTDWGHFIWVLDPERFIGKADYHARIDSELDRIKAVKKKSNVDEIFYAGEQGQRRMISLKESGLVPLSDSTWEVVEQIADSNGVKTPTPQFA